MVWEFGTRGMAKILEAADLDFVFLDMEHSAFSIERVADLIAWLKATPVAPFVRVPQGHYHFLARVMDAGALGVMVPNVETAEHAREIVNAVKYAPQGHRGVGIGTSHTDFLNPDPSSYFQAINEVSTIICQIESMKGVENSRAIAAVPGVDVLWIGHFDLTQSMGIPGQFDDPRFLDSLKHVIAAAREQGKAVGLLPSNMEQADKWLALGVNAIAWQIDSALYRIALQSAVKQLRERISGAGQAAGK